MTAKSNRKVAKVSMSCNPPFEVAGALGGCKTVELTTGIRIAAQVLGEASSRVNSMFNVSEWRILAESLKERAIEPENPTPGPLIALLVERASSRTYLIRKETDLAGLVQKVGRLDYLQAWAVLIACRFRWAHESSVSDNDPWWELPFRWEILRPERT